MSTSLPHNTPQTITAIVRDIHQAGNNGKGSILTVDYAISWGKDDTKDTFQEFFLGSPFHDKTIDKLEPGMAVTITFNIMGREYTDTRGIDRIGTNFDVRSVKIEGGQQKAYARTAVVQNDDEIGF